MSEATWRNRIIGYAEVDPRSLAANPSNWRTHPDHQRLALQGVLSEVGWVAEVLVNQRTGFVVDGHLRVAAALARAESSVPVRYVDLEPDEERLVLATLDPITALATSDSDKLAALLDGLQPADAAVADLLRELTPPRQKQLNPDDADLTPPDAPVTQPGDLWVLGEHRLVCGDASSADDLARLVDGDQVDMVLADPPYGIDVVGSDNRIGTGRLHARVTGDMQPFNPKPYLGLAKDVVLWGANHYADQLPPSAGWLIWDKHDGGRWRSDFADCELAWTNRRSPARIFAHLWGGRAGRSNSTEDQVQQFLHPTQKPVALMSWCIDGNETVLDPFDGCGTTLIAAEQLGRRCYALEIEPAYCDVAVRRWERVSGRQAVQTHA